MFVQKVRENGWSGFLLRKFHIWPICPKLSKIGFLAQKCPKMKFFVFFSRTIHSIFPLLHEAYRLLVTKNDGFGFLGKIIEMTNGQNWLKLGDIYFFRNQNKVNLFDKNPLLTLITYNLSTDLSPTPYTFCEIPKMKVFDFFRWWFGPINSPSSISVSLSISRLRPANFLQNRTLKCSEIL